MSQIKMCHACDRSKRNLYGMPNFYIHRWHCSAEFNQHEECPYQIEERSNIECAKRAEDSIRSFKGYGWVSTDNYDYSVRSYREYDSYESDPSDGW